MKYLLDTNVITEFMKSAPNSGLAQWWESMNGDDLVLSVVTLGEMRKGVERLRPREPQRAASYELWLDGTVQAFAGRIAPIDTAIADMWGRLNAVRSLPPTDSLLAATALHHGWTLVTRNVRVVEGTGCRVLNPFS